MDWRRRNGVGVAGLEQRRINGVGKNNCPFHPISHGGAQKSRANQKKGLFPFPGSTFGPFVVHDFDSSKKAFLLPGVSISKRYLPSLSFQAVQVQLDSPKEMFPWYFPLCFCRQYFRLLFGWATDRQPLQSADSIPPPPLSIPLSLLATQRSRTNCGKEGGDEICPSPQNFSARLVRLYYTVCPYVNDTLLCPK